MTDKTLCALCLPLFLFSLSVSAVTPAVPSAEEVNRPFSDADAETFRQPPKVYRPGTLMFLLGGNVSKEGITADLEALAEAGISNLLLFHGEMGPKNWSGITNQIPCLSPQWEDFLKHTAKECKRLDLRFTFHNCPGWALAGGPWVQPENAMRNLTVVRKDIAVKDGEAHTLDLAVQPSLQSKERDYRDVCVLAFPTPEGETDSPIRPKSKTGAFAQAFDGKGVTLEPTADTAPHVTEIECERPTLIRTIQFSDVEGFSHSWAYEPGVDVKVEAVFPDGTTQTVLAAPMPQSAWQDEDLPMSFACDEAPNASKYRISIVNQHPMSLKYLRVYSAARKNNWESEAAWTLRSIDRSAEHPKQSPSAFVDADKIIDITDKFDPATGQVSLGGLSGNWTVLRFGHVNKLDRNKPAPAEGTGWETDKLSSAGPEAHFPPYLGKLVREGGALEGGLDGTHIDSWECGMQTWTLAMEQAFTEKNAYSLRKWLPAVFGFVLKDHETTSRFLGDWRRTISDLFTNRFYGKMAELAHQSGLTISFETAAGDVFPADLMAFQKFADVPMCEFWQPTADSYVGALNFKPVKPTASAARLYGKPRVAAEALTSFSLTWDEHFEMLKEVCNFHAVEGVSHIMFHTYTHHPTLDFLPPGTSFASGIGTPFLRKQTWWKAMPEFTAYLGRCTYLLERGKPVSDILWYLGDEVNHKPDQKIEFKGFKYDYCNPDALLNRLNVQDGQLVTPEGIAYRILYIPDNERLLPETVEKIVSFKKAGICVVGNPPRHIATLAGGEAAKQRFDTAVAAWKEGGIVSRLEDALKSLQPDVTGGARWAHRRIDGADWYFVCSPQGADFKGTLEFRNAGSVEIWDAVTGNISPSAAVVNGARTSVPLDLPRAGSCFVVFRHDKQNPLAHAEPNALTPLPITGAWTLTFPDGWGAPETLEIAELKAWKDLDLSQEGKAFSGSVTYSTAFDAGDVKPGNRYEIDLGRVDMLAAVTLNGKPLRTLWASPYRLDVSEAIRSGGNILNVEVTGTWFNRLVYDAGQPEAKRKTWTLRGPDKNAPLRESGLLGPVVFYH
jgi:hypothetical protein